jgi:FkbM family methyltransferase
MDRIGKRFTLAVVAMVIVACGAGYTGVLLGIQYERNRACCQVPRMRNIALAIREKLRLTRFYSQIGQDKWVLETVFPGVRNGFFVDVGSADGTHLSNTKALEEKGWSGVCIDPFPRTMQDRTCQMAREVVFSEAGKRMQFQASGEFGGITEKLGVWKDTAMQAATVEFTTTTIGDILERTNAPPFIHFVSLDIEGAELEALKGFPFDRHKVGAFAIEHNYEEPKRSQILALLERHGYRRIHSWQHDDFYVSGDLR